MHSYAELKQLVVNEPAPSFWVDLDALDRNLERTVKAAAAHKKSIRLATKSVRVPYLIRYLREKSAGVISGLMCYGADEACLLAEQGEDNLLIAYPIADERAIARLGPWMEKGKSITLMVDELAHLDAIERAIPHGPRVAVCLDIDVSFRPLGLHLGVRRSPLVDEESLRRFVRQIENSPRVTLVGVMGYEAQIAGLTDKNPFKAWMDGVAVLLKKLSLPNVRARRAEAADLLRRQGLPLTFFNGGGTGSLQASLADPTVTEVAVGSGFLQSHLFDYYRANRNEAASFFCLRVTRVPAAGFVTCHGGGFVASGSPGWDKCPRPFLPAGLKTLGDEGFGEVQTPFRLPPDVKLYVGDPVFCRSAKAGEIAENFSHYYLFRGGKIVDKVPTYRGLGL